jgi:diguanylate cyclase (GGDEF)-like protein
MIGCEMNEKITRSLSSKIVFSIAIVSLLSLAAIFTIFEKISKESFYNIETEKAKIIAETIEPLIAVNIYLDMKEKVNETALQLIKNPNVLAIKILKNEKIINQVESKDYNKSIGNSFVVEQIIFKPNSDEKIGSIVLTYSSQNYKELSEKYNILIFVVLSFFGLLFVLLGLYIKRLLSPLRKIAKSLKNFSLDAEMEIPLITEDNEIGLISSALNSMKENILYYSKQQQNIQYYLEEEINKKTAELTKRLYTNTLTGLPNRLSLLKKMIKDGDVALLILNIDDFKEINDFYGHEVGDQILIEFSLRLKKMFNEENKIALQHLGADEFSLLFIQKPSLSEFIIFIQQLVIDVEKMIYFYENNELGIRVTLGASYQKEGALEKADIALKSAKKQKKSYLIYDEKLNVEKQYKNNMEWVKKLKYAMETDNIVPFFQAIFDNKSNEVVSYECLIRLINKDGEVITPYSFLTIARKSRLYSQLTKIMIRKSCQYFEYLNFDFSVNLSVEDILDKETVEYIKMNIEKYHVSKKIVFEILESEGIENYGEISLFIKEMKLLGCRIAIDDFGSGYSNFEHLLKLDIDYIKIDGSLIKNLDTDINAQMVVETIIDFAEKLNILTIAEFVHNEAILKKVKELNVNRTQGFFLAEPKAEILKI